MTTLAKALVQLAAGDVDDAVARAAWRTLVAGDGDDLQAAALLFGLRAARPSADTLAALAEELRASVVPVRCSRRPLVDTAGTGGGPPTVSISTAAAIVAAAAGCAVAKHGNRSATSRCGSADVLEALGVDIARGAEEVGRDIDDRGFGFLFAPVFHPSMASIAQVRRRLGVPTVANLLGPLANPAASEAQVIGVSDPAVMDTVAAAAELLGVRRVLVVHGLDGLDELTVTAPSTVVERIDGRVRRYDVGPEAAGLRCWPSRELRGGAPEHNAAVLRSALAGTAGAARDVTLLNAGAAIYVAGRAGDLREGVRLAREAVDDGAAAALLDRLPRRAPSPEEGSRDVG